MRNKRHWAGPAGIICALAGACVLASSASAQEANSPSPAAPITVIPDIVPETITEAATDGATPLFLSVIVNGRETDLIAEFSLSPDGRLSSVSSELEEVGIRAPGRANRRVFLDQVAGLSYRYDEGSQTLELSAAPAALLPNEIGGRPIPEFVEPQAGYGAVLNYRITANSGDDLLEDGFRLKSLFMPLEGRIYSPIGVFTTTGHVSATSLDFNEARFRRHNTNFIYSNPRRMLSFTIGDTVSSSLPWTRPIRMGGIQVRRDFSLRSDVLTQPLLSYSGVAALPSAIDLYVEGVRAWGGQAEPGPFVVTDLPFVTSRGEAVFVVRDEAGNQSVERVSFFSTRNLLRKGQLDFSIEAGRARQDFGTSNFNYGKEAVATASFRYGMTNQLTLQGHFEGAKNLIAGSFGLTTVPFGLAEVTVAAGASRYGDMTGTLGFMELRTEVGEAEIRLTSTRTSPEYRDLAYVTGLEYFGTDVTNLELQRLQTSRVQDALSISFPFKEARFGLNLIRSERADVQFSLASASYSQRFAWKDSSFLLNMVKDLSSGEYEAAMAFSIPVGERSTASSRFSRSRSGDHHATMAFARSLGQDNGSYGYSTEFASTEGGAFAGRGNASYRSRYGVIEAGFRYDGDAGRAMGTASLEGAVVAAGGGLFLGNRIPDAFAVVDVGVPNVPIKLHNRTAARTNAFGKALIPNLQSYRNNRIALDPNDLPLDAAVDATAMNVVPARHSGVSISFGGSAQSSALVVLRNEDGDFVAPGSSAILNGAGEAVPVGYDGEVWLEDLRSRNQLVVESSRGVCIATFDYRPSPGEMVIIDPVECS